MPAIEVDFEVYKELIRRRPNEAVSENDVLRQVLGLANRKCTVPVALAGTVNFTPSSPMLRCGNHKFVIGIAAGEKPTGISGSTAAAACTSV